MTPTTQFLWNINNLRLTLICGVIWRLFSHRADSGDWASISSTVDESFNLFLPFKDRNKLFLGLRHGDGITIGEIMSMKQFECLTDKNAKCFQRNLLNFLTQRLKQEIRDMILSITLRRLGRREILSCLRNETIALWFYRGVRREASLSNKFLMNS